MFLTAPEAAFGRSLYGIYSDLGYGAESILKQRNRRMVALVLRYPTGIRFIGERGGQGPLAGNEYDQFIYVPTWKNAFALLARLAGDPSPDPKNPRLLQFSAEAERNLARYYPAERRDHI